MEVEDGSEENPKGGDEAGSVEIAGREIGMRKARALSPWWGTFFRPSPGGTTSSLTYRWPTPSEPSSASSPRTSSFLPAMVIGYWITNILGFVLMHRGIKEIVSKKTDTGYSRGDMIKDLTVSIVYTVIVVVLVAAGFLKLPAEYFP